MLNKFAHFVILAILGIALGILVGNEFFYGHFSKWYQITPPEPVDHLIKTFGGDLWAEATSGNLYLCHNTQCQHESGTPPTDEGFEIAKRCNASYSSEWPMFTLSTHPPHLLIDCRETILFFDH